MRSNLVLGEGGKVCCASREEDGQVAIHGVVGSCDGQPR